MPAVESSSSEVNLDNRSKSKFDLQQDEDTIVETGAEHDKFLKLKEAYERYELSRVIGNLDRPVWFLRPVAKFLEPIWEYCHFKLGPKRPDADKLKLNILYDSLLGLISGILIGYVSFFLFVFTFSHQPQLSTILSCYVVLFSVFGMAFSSGFRCIVLLTLPYLVAGRVRWLLMLYASGLAASKPGLNFLHNSGNFRNSIACILTQVMTNMALVKRISKAPMRIIGSKIVNLIEGLNQALAHIRSQLNLIHWNIFKFTNILHNQSSWIISLIRACKSELALENQCLSFMNNMYFICKANVYQTFNDICLTVRGFSSQVCTSNNLTQFVEVCNKHTALLNDQDNYTTSHNLVRQLDDIHRVLGVHNLTLLVEPNQISPFQFETDPRLFQVLDDKMNYFVHMTNRVKVVIVLILALWTLATLWMLVVKAFIFKHLWLTKDMFDNFYITRAFIKQEKDAARQGLVPTAPLVSKEKKTYKKLTSISWTISERRRALRSFLSLFLLCFSIVLIMFCDYAMYGTLVTILPVYSIDIRRLQSNHSARETRPTVKGDSSFASIVRTSFDLFEPIKDLALDVDSKVCQPVPIEPDNQANVVIGILFILTWTSVVVEVYVLRLRHVIMISYYPIRAAQRAAWLRVHIRNNRGLFLKLVHKLYTINVKSTRKAGKTTCFGRFLSKHLKIKALLEYAGIRRINCTYCGKEGTPSTDKEGFVDEFKQCLECGVYYCRQCQVELKQICMLCRTPLFALGIEVDLEQYSSDEEFETVESRYMFLANRKNSPKNLQVLVDQMLKNVSFERESI